MLNNFDRSELESRGALQGLIDRGLIEERVAPRPKARVGRKGSCEACEFCVEPSCARCHGCRDGSTCFRKVCGPTFAASSRSPLLQNANTSLRATSFKRMCQYVPIETKAMVAKGFPDGWKFVFHRQQNHPRAGPCLVLLAPNGMRRYREVSKAINHNKKQLEKVSASAFYKYIGVDAEKGSDCPRPRRGDDKHEVHDESESTSEPSALCETHDYKTQLSSLRRLACGICVMCDKPDCMLCIGCSLDDPSAGEKRTICLHKVRPYSLFHVLARP